MKKRTEESDFSVHGGNPLDFLAMMRRVCTCVERTAGKKMEEGER